MSDFKAKMHQNPKFGWGSAPGPAGGAYSDPPDPLAGFKGPTSKGREGREGGGEGLLIREGGGGRGGEREGPRLLRFPPGSMGARIVTAYSV